MRSQNVHRGIAQRVLLPRGGVGDRNIPIQHGGQQALVAVAGGGVVIIHVVHQHPVDGERFQHIRQPANVVGIGMGGDDIIQPVDPLTTQIVHHFFAGGRLAAVDQHLVGAAADQRGIGVADIQKVHLQLAVRQRGGLVDTGLLQQALPGQCGGNRGGQQAVDGDEQGGQRQTGDRDPKAALLAAGYTTHNGSSCGLWAG